MNVVEQLRLFMEPRSVALIGVPRATNTGVNTVEFMLEYGYDGRIYPVNPSADSILGQKAYPAVQEIPDPVDLAVISVPRQLVPEVVRGCVEKGIKAVVVVSQGFADADQQGKALQERVVAIAKAGGARVIGPNSMGTVNAFKHFSCAFVHLDVPKQVFPVGFAAQSGLVINLGLLGSQYGDYRFLGKAFDLGNTCDVDFADVLEYFEADPQVEVIALHMEGIQDGRRFLEVARRVTRKKPVVAIKAGRTEQGGKAVASHTGAMVGQDEVYQAAFDEAGIIRVKDLEELEDMVKVFFTAPLPKGNRVGMVTLVGGIGVMAVDACADLGLEMPELSSQVKDRLGPLFPDWFPPANPVDIWPASYARPFREVNRDALEALMEDPGIDALVAITWVPRPPRFEIFDSSEDMLAVAQKYPQKPLICFCYGPTKNVGILQIESSRQIAAYPSIERTLRAVAALWRYSRYRQMKPGQEPGLPVNQARGQAVVSVASRLGRPRLDAEGFDLLDAYGIKSPPSRIAGGEEEAAAAARAVGFPVVLKVLSPQITHKSDAGGVRLGIGAEDELRRAYREMIETIAKKAPGAEVEGVLVQRMASGGQEVILGIKRDSQFGPVVIFGAGGLYAEVMKDVAFGICPLTRERAWEMVRSTRVYHILKGLREAPKDLEAIVEALLRLSQLAVDLPQVKELDINPMLSLEEGCTAVDVRVVIGD